MSTLSNIQPAQTGNASYFDASDWRTIVDRFVAAWKVRQQARAQRRIDGYYRERRHIDLWRVY